MARSPIVGSRKIKTGLGTYLNRVRRGETILDTDRNEPGAELRPVSGASDAKLARLRTAAAAGVETWPVRPPPGRVTPIRARGKLGAPAPSTDRDDRGQGGSLPPAP